MGSLPLPFSAEAISLDYGDSDYPYSPASPHNGIDFSSGRLGVVFGSKILASAEGIVHRANHESGTYYSPNIDRPNANAGNSIDVDYPDYGVRVRYMHRIDGCPSPNAGDRVRLRSMLGQIGNTGYVFGAHLHMETWDLSTGRRISPYYFFNRGFDVFDDAAIAAEKQNNSIFDQLQEDDMSLAALKVDGAHFFTIDKEYLSHNVTIAQSDIARQIFSGQDELHEITSEQLFNLMDAVGIPRDVVAQQNSSVMGAVLNPETGVYEPNGVWSRERQIVANLRKK